MDNDVDNKQTYWERVKRIAKALKGDGCTGVPDLTYKKCCDRHDIHYRTKMRLEDTGIPTPITRAEADKEMFKCMRETGKTPIIGSIIVPGLYWLGVRLFGSGAWNKDRSKLDE